MRILNPASQNCRRNGVIGIGLLPQTAIRLVLNHVIAHDYYQVVVPPHSTFGYLKSVITQKLGLQPEMHKLVFRGKVHDDAEDLQTAGAINNSEVLLIEDGTCNQKIPEVIPEDVPQTSVASKGEEAVAEVRDEIDKLERQVSSLKVVLDCGTKIDDKEIICLTEMLMRQLLKLDGIEADGEGRVQRRMEVRRVQSLVETLDDLKLRNSNASTNSRKIASATTQQEAYDRVVKVAEASYSMPACSVPSSLENFSSSTSPGLTFSQRRPLSPSYPMLFAPTPRPHIPIAVTSAPFSAPSYLKINPNRGYCG